MERVESAKEKWEITIDTMLIVGKYFKSNNDFINSMKVAKRFHDLTQMYHFNPINDISLFENIETQHFYLPEYQTNEIFISKLFGHSLTTNIDITPTKKEGMYQYVYWYNPNRELEENEVMKPYIFNKYVLSNISTLEEWSKKKFDKILYDSDRDGIEETTFGSKVLNQKQLYFIVIDSNNNVFGHYHPGIIDKVYAGYFENNNDDNLFLFTLYSNGRSGIKKFNRGIFKHTRTHIDSLRSYYDCGFEYPCFQIRKVGTNESEIFGYDIEHGFKGMKQTTFTGKAGKFTTQRLVVIQMK